MIRWLHRLLRSWRQRVPGPLDMAVGTRVVCLMPDGSRRHGEYRDAAPDGSYAIRLDGEPGCLRAFASVQLERRRLRDI